MCGRCASSVACFRATSRRPMLDWGGQRLVIRGTMEPLAEGSEAFMAVEPRRVVLLEE